MNYWITSDTHFGHARIINYCNRPFKDVDHMNIELARRWNERIKSDDQVIFLGDFCFKNSNEERGEGLNRPAPYWSWGLNGHITFVKGNHDRNNSLKTIISFCVINYAGEDYFCVHNPKDYDSRYKINFVGHVHNNWRFRKIKNTVLINVSCDVTNFMPLTIDEHLKEYNFYIKNNRVEEYVPYEEDIH